MTSKNSHFNNKLNFFIYYTFSFLINYILLGTYNIIDNIFDIYNHSLGININKRIINVNIEITMVNVLDKANSELKYTLFIIFSFFKRKAGILIFCNLL